MIYEFECSCGEDWTESRMLATRHEPSVCKSCGASVLKREIPSRTGGFVGAGDWDTCTYNRALGQVVRNNLHAKKIAKSRGLTEIGNESIDSIHKKFDMDRDRKRESAYDITQITNLGEIKSV